MTSRRARRLPKMGGLHKGDLLDPSAILESSQTPNLHPCSPYSAAVSAYPTWAPPFLPPCSQSMANMHTHAARTALVLSSSIQCTVCLGHPVNRHTPTPTSSGTAHRLVRQPACARSHTVLPSSIALRSCSRWCQRHPPTCLAAGCVRPAACASTPRAARPTRRSSASLDRHRAAHAPSLP